MIGRHFRLEAGKLRIQPSDDLEHLIQVAFAAATGPATRNDTLRLDLFIRTVAEDLDREASRSNIGDQLCGLVSSFGAEARALCCETCAEKAGAKPCNGTIADQSVQAVGMACWEFLSTLFESLLQLAHDQYRPLLPDHGPNDLEVELRTRIAAGRDLGAQTQFSDDLGVQRTAQVILDLPEEHFADRHIYRLPYVLFHEIFVHTAESWLETTKRRPTNETCPFREGFVDAAAAGVLARHPEILPEFYKSFFSNFAFEVEAAHSARFDLGDPGLDDGTLAALRRRKAIQYRREGRLAFYEVEKLSDFQNACSLAMAVNLLPLNCKERQLFVELLFDTKTSQSGNRRKWLGQLLQHAQSSYLDRLEKDIREELAKSDF